MGVRSGASWVQVSSLRVLAEHDNEDQTAFGDEQEPDIFFHVLNGGFRDCIRLDGNEQQPGYPGMYKEKR